MNIKISISFLTLYPQRTINWQHLRGIKYFEEKLQNQLIIKYILLPLHKQVSIKTV